MSDDDLSNLLATRTDHTPFAVSVAREELSRRRRTNDNITSANKTISSCYLDLWRDKNFEGEHVRIAGPAEYRVLNATTLDWGDDISSLRVGPTAFVMLYSDKEFKGEMISFGPCQEVPDLHEFKFNDDIDSFNLINSLSILERALKAPELVPPLVKTVAGRPPDSRKSRKKNRRRKA